MSSSVDRKIILIGGAPSSGKTTLAHQLAAITATTVFSLDEMVAGESDRLLLRAETWDSPAEVVQLLRAANQQMAPILDLLIERFLTEKLPTIIEGARISPTVCAELMEGREDIEALFLVEPDEDFIRSNLWLKSQSFRLLEPARRESMVAVNAEYGRQVEAEARIFGLPQISPQPWATLWLRACQALAKRS